MKMKSNIGTSGLIRNTLVFVRFRSRSSSYTFCTFKRLSIIFKMSNLEKRWQIIVEYRFKYFLTINFFIYYKIAYCGISFLLYSSITTCGSFHILLQLLRTWRTCHTNRSIPFVLLFFDFLNNKIRKLSICFQFWFRVSFNEINTA